MKSRRRHIFASHALILGTLLVAACVSHGDSRSHETIGAVSGALTASGDLSKVKPTVSCIVSTTDPLGRHPGLAAVFGYENTSNETVVAPIGPSNGITETGASNVPAFGRGQPVAFEPGPHDSAFVVDSADGSLGPLVWTLGSNTVTASTSSPVCATSAGVDGPIVGRGGVLVRPDPSSILPSSIVPTETGVQGTAIGAVAGSFQVAGGAAAYSIPLWTPPARMGMGPSLSLTFNSHQENRGLAGVGWSLSGFSRIERCAKTVAQDGDAAAISFNDDIVTGDSFCLDGQRLWLQEKINDAKRSYAPERDPFTRVEFDTSASTFRVYQRDGRVLTYGTSPDTRDTGTRWQYVLDDTSGPKPVLSQVNYAWLLDSVTDPVGNRMTLTYKRYSAQEALVPNQESSCSQLVPGSINYTAGPETAEDRWPARRWVDFEYETTEEPSCRFISGFGFGSSARLTHVRMNGPGGTSPLLHSYNLAYSTSDNTHRSLLASVEECDGAGVCMPRTSFDYSTGTHDFDSVADVGAGWRAPFGAIYYDWDADGLDDLINQPDPNNPVPVLYHNDGSHFVQTNTQAVTTESSALRSTSMNAKDDTPLFVAAPHPPPCTVAQIKSHNCKHPKTPPRFANPVLLADLDGNGENDLVAQSAAAPGNWLFRLTDFSGSVAWSGNMALPTMAAPDTLHTSDPDPSMYEYVASVDGSGKSAFLFRRGFADGTDSPYLVAVTANAATGKLVATTTTLPVGDKWQAVPNDNCDDGFWFWSSFGPCQATLSETNDKTFYWVFVDLNNDGNTDALQVPVTGGAPKVALNMGAGFGPVTVLPGASNDLKLPDHTVILPSAFPPFQQAIQVADFNGDGLPDILVNGTDIYWSRGARGVLADKFSALGNVIDFDGDGQPDIATQDNRVYRHATKADQLTGIHDGLGKDINVGYVPITDSTVYTRPTNCAYPKNCVTRGLWVVREADVSTDWGVAGKAGAVKPSAFQYHYEGARADVRGRGSLGFASQTVTNVQTGAKTTTTYNNDETDSGYGYPRAGLPASVVTTAWASASVQRVSTTTTSYDALPKLGGHGVVVHPNSTETTVVERVSRNGAWTEIELAHTRTTFAYDAYENVTQRETTYVSGDPEQQAVERVQAQYDQVLRTDKWMLSLLRRTDITSSEGGWQTPVTRSHTFDPDMDTGLLKHETIEPEGTPDLKQDITYTRDERGQVTHVAVVAADPASGATMSRDTWMTYDDESLFPVSVTNSLGQTVRAIYHPGLGLPVFAQDANGVVAHTRYDGFGRVRSEEAAGIGAVTTHYRDGTPFPGLSQGAAIPGLYSVETDVAGGGHGVVTYNALGDAVARAARNHDGAYSYVETRYTGIPGQVASISRPAAQTAPTLFTTFTYDGLGRALTKALPDGRVSSVRYHNFGTTTVDPRGHLRTSIVDKRGRLVRVDEESITGLPDTSVNPTIAPPVRTDTSVSTNYGYGPFGTLVRSSTTDRNGVTTLVSTMAYDDLGRRTSFVEANSGKSTITYNGFGEIVTTTDANAQTHTVTHDELGRVVSDLSSAEGETTFEWDTAAHGVGKISKATSFDAITTRYAYDENGASVGTQWHVAGADYAVTTEPDDFGRPSTITYPKVGADQLSINLEFDAIGGVKTAHGGDTSAPFSWGALTWNASGQTLTEQLGTDTTTTHVYDEKSAWLTDIVTQKPSETVQNLHYEYDADANVRTRQDKLLGTTETFDHDWLERTHSWTFTSSQGSWASTYEYSDIGNIQSKAVQQQGGPLTMSAYSYGTRDAAGAPGSAGIHAATTVGGDAYSYDAKGNQISGPARTIKYTSFDLPRQITKAFTTTSFKYDASHRRTLKQSSDGSSTLYAGGAYEKRSDANGSVTHVFHVLGMADVEWKTDSSGSNITARKVIYLHQDHLGSLVATSSPSAPTEQFRYDPFGKRVDPYAPVKPAPGSSSDVRSGFTSQEHDDELGLINMQGRIYDPQIGRFLSADPLVSVPTSQGFNRYSYVLNQPMALTDPSGFAPASGSFGAEGTASGCQQNAYSPGGNPGMHDCGKDAPLAVGACEQRGDQKVCATSGDTAYEMTTITKSAAPPSKDSNGTRVAGPGTTPDVSSGYWNGMRQPTSFTRARQPTSFTRERWSPIENSSIDMPKSLGQQFKDGLIQVMKHPPPVAGGGAATLVETNAPRLLALVEEATVAEEGLTAAEEVVATGACFVGGTLVATSEGEQPIETLSVGDRVLTSRDDGDGSTSIEPANWKHVRLRMPNPDGSGDILDIQVLRPTTWLTEVGASTGGWISFALPEMGLYGPARVQSVSALPHIQDGPGRVVRATVTHLNSQVHVLKFRETAEILEPTATHRLYSVDRRDWVAAEELKIGEHLWAKAGAITIAANAEKKGTERVYNIEVETEHSYLVGHDRILSHNVNPCAAAARTTSTITDPGLADFVDRLKDAGVKVTNTNVSIFGQGGQAVGEVDVVTENALIQFKNGTSSAHEVIEQVTLRTEPFVDRPVITFINGTGRAAARTVSGAAGRGLLITNDFATLVEVLK